MSNEIGDLEVFSENLETWSKRMDESCAEWLDALAVSFLDIVRDELMRTATTDIHPLWQSFEKGDEHNVYEWSVRPLTLRVGTDRNEASQVNDGTFLVEPGSGEEARWVPGYWDGDRFIYDPDSQEGMNLVIRWTEGTGFWDAAIILFEKVFQRSLENRLQKRLDSLTGGEDRR